MIQESRIIERYIKKVELGSGIRYVVIKQVVVGKLNQEHSYLRKVGLGGCS